MRRRRGRGYIPVPIGAPLPGTKTSKRGSRRNKEIGLTHGKEKGGRVYIPVPRHRCTPARYCKTTVISH